ncbi:MAG: hypothetical protein MRY64_05680 [Hyphomonadaceae bacterium]|nr:hypothetical protein [Hyphomonadaceae bacterium]
MPLLSLLTLVSLAILIMLGNWQYERYKQKRGSGPENLPPVESISVEVIDLPGKAVQNVYGIADGEPIWRRYVLVTRTSDQATLLMAADATGGINPVEMAVPGGLRMSAEVRIFPRVGRVSARNRPEENLWHVFDRAGILSRYGLGDADIPVAEPAELTIRSAEDPARMRTTQNPYGAPDLLDPLPPERHFGYALTWWGLAIALIVIYGVFHHSRGRLSFGERK